MTTYVLLALVLAIEWSLPRMKGVRANSIVEALVNAFLEPTLRRVPGARAIVRVMGTPERVEAEGKPVEPPKES